MFSDYSKNLSIAERSSRLRESPWLWTSERARTATVRLVCLPYAGAGAGVFVPWAKLLPESIDLWAVRPPGRESRWKEPQATSMQTLIHVLADEISPYLGEIPYAILGYSVGSLVGFELIRELRRRGVAMPKLFLAAARGAPQRTLRRNPIHHLPNREFVEAIAQRYQGIPQIILEDPELLRLYLPPLRADLALNETYQYREEPPLDLPVAALGGLDDPSVGADDLAAWRVQTSSAFAVEMMPGGHFFLQDQRTQLVATIQRRLFGI